jgi:hypothetical protein
VQASAAVIGMTNRVVIIYILQILDAQPLHMPPL